MASGDSRHDSNPPLKDTIRWGRPKLIEIAGNAIIPFFYWEASVNSSFGFQDYLLDLYFNLPQLNRYGRLKNLEVFLEKSNLKRRKFYQDQGLLYLYQQHCSTGDCKVCPLIHEHKEIDKNLENI